MRIWLNVFGGIAIVVISFLVTHVALERFWPVNPCLANEAFELKKPFNKTGGFAYVRVVEKFAKVSDDAENSVRSPMLVCENERLIGPAHVPLDDIIKTGAGRFSHWGPNVFFSTPDNSDPNANGRRYRLVQK